MKKHVLLPIIIVCLVQCAEAQTFMTEAGHAEFTSSVPLHTFTGTSEQLVGKINLADSTVDFYVDLTTFDTGISKRDKDMRRTLNTEEYPFAEFYGKLITPFDTSAGKAQSVTVEGEFSIHGITRDIQIDGTLQKTGEGLQVNAAWVVNLADYEIEPPGILFYRVDEEQEVKIEALLTPVEESSL